MENTLARLLRPKKTESFAISDGEFERLGIKLKKEADAIFGRSLAIRELDTGSDNAAEIELVNLTTPHYDIERYGITFVASPRHADVLIVTGAVTHNMAIAAKKTYDAMPGPKFVIAVGDDACDGGIYKGTYAVLGGADKILPVDLKIPGNPPTPKQILTGLLALAKKIRETRH
ncbi:MAG: NADH-quinone oxidoreductase subunit B family protein [Candidatus Altiarchaeota archaeon]|nr:NADH-quinone oxidoreductase subunit B family protein [Candidatus Altiarchaeota archaeon]